MILIFIFLISLTGLVLRFYNLDWGNPIYFHPDERNIASSVMQLSFPKQMNPNFFAYGSFPIYLIYFTQQIIQIFNHSSLIINPFLVSRFYSAILSVLIIPSIYLIGEKIANKKVGIISAVFTTFSVGLIQFAHFGTFEMWLTFLTVWFFYFSLKLLEQLKLINILIIGIIYGILLATKISSLPLLLLPLAAIVLNISSKRKMPKTYSLLFKLFIKTLILIAVSLVIFAIFSPYNFLDFKSFASSIKYESSVALGTLPVFYTEEFFNSAPVIFQFTKIYPFLINPVLTIIFIPSFIYIAFDGIKNKNILYLILNTCYLILFIPQAFLFTKWTRYIVPTLPFMYLIIAIAFFNLMKFLNKKTNPLFNYQYAGISLIMLISIIFSISYFITVFVKQDTRIAASLWAKENIPRDSIILSEVYDMGIVPFNPYFNNISLFNFYDLDHAPDIKSQELKELSSNIEYIILPSQRILETRLLNKDKFPVGNEFYKNLIGKNMEYIKIYETPCDIFCKITYLEKPTKSFEQTASVFDRPTVFIYKKL